MRETGNVNVDDHIMLNETLKQGLNYLSLPECQGDNQDVEI